MVSSSVLENQRQFFPIHLINFYCNLILCHTLHHQLMPAQMEKRTNGRLDLFFRDIMNAWDVKERNRRKTAYEELPNDPSRHMLHVLLPVATAEREGPI